MAIDGAAVRVSLVCFSRAADKSVHGARLDGQAVDEIYTDLTARRSGAGVDLTEARRLPENAGVAFVGDTKGGPFDISGEQAREWLRLPANPNGCISPASHVFQSSLAGSHSTPVLRPTATIWDRQTLRTRLLLAQDQKAPRQGGRRKLVHRLRLLQAGGTAAHLDSALRGAANRPSPPFVRPRPAATSPAQPHGHVLA